MENKRSKKLGLALIVIGITLLATACVPGNGSNTPTKPAGLISGIWHGWIAPFSLILSIFNKSIRIYETYNTGFWYDFGFYAAIISGFGGLSLSREKKKNKKRK